MLRPLEQKIKHFIKNPSDFPGKTKSSQRRDGPLGEGCSQERLGLALREALLWAVSGTGDPQTASEPAPAQASPPFCKLFGGSGPSQPEPNR